MTRNKRMSEQTRYGLVFWMLCLFFLFQYARPQTTFTAIAPLRIPLMLSLIMPVLWLAWGDKRVLKDPLIVLYGLFVALCGITVLWAHNQFWVVETTKYLTIFLIAATLPAAGLLQDRRKISTFFVFWVCLHLYVAWVSITNEGRGTGSFLGDENDMALTINMAIPYAYFLLQSRERGGLFKLLMIFALAAMGFAIINSDSRGGLVGLFAVTAGILFFTKHRIRNTLVIATFATVAYLSVPEGYVEEMQTMTDPNDATRYERLYSWRLGWHMYLDYPIAGVGAGNYPWRVEEYEVAQGEYTGRRLLGGRVAHSLYFTLIPELGTLGVLLFGAMTVLIFRRVWFIIRREEQRAIAQTGDSRAPPTEANLLARAMLVSLVGLFSSGAFISVLYYPHFWFLIGFVLALYYTTEETAPEPRSALAKRRAAGMLPASVQARATGR